MDVSVVKIIFLVGYVQLFLVSREHEINKINPLFNNMDGKDQDRPKPINGSKLDFYYYNLQLGNDRPIKIEFGNESAILDYWVDGLPLKLVTHGWLASDANNSGVFTIVTAYIDTRSEYNFITADWSHIAENIIYPAAAVETEAVGRAFADFLDRLIGRTGLEPTDVHLIGHSLGAHVVGAAGAHLKSGKIGRITALDPASPCFEILNINNKFLKKENAEFVDVIHTAAGTLGFESSVGHVDFFPNSGKDPQPGCALPIKSVLCSHSRAHELYTDSVYHRNSLFGLKCSSWRSFQRNQCKNNEVVPMGHDAIPSSRGDFYERTNSQSPYSRLLWDESGANSS